MNVPPVAQDPALLGTGGTTGVLTPATSESPLRGRHCISGTSRPSDRGRVSQQAVAVAELGVHLSDRQAKGSPGPGVSSQSFRRSSLRFCSPTEILQALLESARYYRLPLTLTTLRCHSSLIPALSFLSLSLFLPFSLSHIYIYISLTLFCLVWTELMCAATRVSAALSLLQCRLWRFFGS